MSYEPTIWKKGDKVTSTKLNKIENGIQGNDTEISNLKSGLSGMTTATAEDVGKALKAKTVTDGKVTEWEFGEAGGDSKAIESLDEQMAMLVNKEPKPQPLPTEIVQCVNLDEEGIRHYQYQDTWRYQGIKCVTPYDGTYYPNPYGITNAAYLQAYGAGGNILTPKSGSNNISFKGRMVLSNDRTILKCYLPEPDGRLATTVEFDESIAYLSHTSCYLFANNITESDKLGITYGDESSDTYIEYDETKFPARPEGYNYNYNSELFEAVNDYTNEHYTAVTSINSATGEDVGKALIANNVSDGKVTDWTFKGVASANDIPHSLKLLYYGTSDGTGTYSQARMNVVCEVETGKHLKRIGVIGNSRANGEKPTLNILVSDSSVSGRYKVVYSKELSPLVAEEYSYTDIDFITTEHSYIAIGESDAIVGVANANIGHTWMFYSLSNVTAEGYITPTVNTAGHTFYGVALWEDGESEINNAVDIADSIYTEKQAIEIFPDETWYKTGTTYSAQKYYISPRFIPANTKITKVRFKANTSGTASVMFASYALHEKTSWMIAVSIIENIAYSEGWNEIEISKTFNENVLIGFKGISTDYANYANLAKDAEIDHRFKFGSSDLDTYTTNAFFATDASPSEGERFALGKQTKTYWVAFPFTWYTEIGDLPSIKTEVKKLMPEYEKRMALRTEPVRPKYKVVEGSLGFVGKWYTNIIDGQTAHICNVFGCEMYCRVRGASELTLNLGNTDYLAHTFYAYNIDGGEFTREECTNAVITIPDTNPHIVRIVFESLNDSSPQWQVNGGFVVFGASVDSGICEGLEPVDVPLIVQLGDSIAVGTRALGVAQSGEVESDYHSATNSYSFVCAQALNAINYMNAYGGTGIANNGTTAKCVTAIEYAANGIPAEPIVADMVIIEHGHNDPTMAEDAFEAAYIDTLNVIRAMYSGAPIVCVVPFNDRHRDTIRSLVPNQKDCYLVDCYEALPFTYYVDGPGHLTAEGAQAIGTFIAKKIKEYGLL